MDKQSKSHYLREDKKSQQQSLISKEQKEEPPSPPPQLQLEKILHRTTIAATLLFLFHLRISPTTCRAWRSAAQFLASVGLAATAVSASVASKVLSPDSARSFATSNPIVGLVCYKVFDGLATSPWCRIPFDIYDRIPIVSHQVREELKKNKRLQAALALMVLCGIKHLPRKCFYSRHDRGMKRQSQMWKSGMR